MQRLTAVVLGATGLTGNLLVRELVKDPDFEKVRLLVRRSIEAGDAKVEVEVVDFSDPASFKGALGSGHVIFCCIGTTMKKMKGDKQAYRRVDYDIPVHAAKFGVENGYNKFLLQSSAGANASSGNFYLKLKGEVESAIAALAFDSVHVFQPSLLLGDRSESRLAEQAGKVMMKMTSFLLTGKAQKYKAIEALDVARAMVTAAKNDITRVRVYTYKEIRSLSMPHQ